MKISDEWWTSPAVADNGRLVTVTGRDDIQNVRDTGKYIYRIDVHWAYNPTADGLPDDADGALMEQAHDALLKAFAADPVAVMTGVYTGDGSRDWVFYTRSLFIFQKVFNRALEELPAIPLTIEASEDSDWEEYDEMRRLTYIPPGE